MGISSSMNAAFYNPKFICTIVNTIQSPNYGRILNGAMRVEIRKFPVFQALPSLPFTRY